MNIFLAKERSKCLACKQEFLNEDADFHCVFVGSLEEPPEWEMKCPHCGSVDVEEIITVFCRDCGDVVVQHEGEQCSECATCQAEARYDESIGK